MESAPFDRAKHVRNQFGEPVSSPSLGTRGARAPHGVVPPEAIPCEPARVRCNHTEATKTESGSMRDKRRHRQ